MNLVNAQKLALGTVQFGVPYGISNEMGVPGDVELTRILDVAYSAGITILDCAPAYGNAEDRIGRLSLGRFKIVTKFSGLHEKKIFNNLLRQSLERLKSQELYGYIAHNSDELIAKPELWESLSLAKQDKKIKKIGYSLYVPQQLETLLSLGMKPDIVQLPYNILDRKFENYLPELKENGTEIHVRSVFLQGLFFLDPEKIPNKIRKLRPVLLKLQNISRETGLSISELAISFATSNMLIDQVVIGVASSSQLTENIRNLVSSKTTSDLLGYINNIKVEDTTLLNPVNWS